MPGLTTNLAWYASSVIAACAGALAAGAWLSRGLGPSITGAAGVGFVVIVAIPILLIGSIIVRGLYAEWRVWELPGAAARLRYDLPRAIGWLVAIGLAVVAFAWMIFRGTWMLASLTQFKPNVIALAQPVFGVLSALLLAIATPIAANLLVAALAHIDTRRRRAGKKIVVTPRRLIAAMLVLGATALWVVWRFVIAPRVIADALRSYAALGPARIAIAPLLALGAMLAVHVLWRAGRVVRGALAIVCAGGAIVMLVLAFVTGLARPTAALAIRADAPVPGAVLGALFGI